MGLSLASHSTKTSLNSTSRESTKWCGSAPHPADLAAGWITLPKLTLVFDGTWLIPPDRTASPSPSISLHVLNGENWSRMVYAPWIRTSLVPPTTSTPIPWVATVLNCLGFHHLRSAKTPATGATICGLFPRHFVVIPVAVGHVQRGGPCWCRNLPGGVNVRYVDTNYSAVTQFPGAIHAPKRVQDDF
jgi:hypothetical protein